MKVANFTVYNDNPYQELLNCHTDLEFEKAHVDSAIRLFRAGKIQAFHVHWEEHILRQSPTQSEARVKVAYFLKRLQNLKLRGCPILLTVHNLAPHELEFPGEFNEMRQGVIDCADRVLVHNFEAVEKLNSAYTIEPSKYYYFPHMSYVGAYEPVDETRSRVEARRNDGPFMLFGKVRRYKAFDKLLEGMVTHEMYPELEIVGNGIPGDSYVDDIRGMVDSLENVTFDEQHVPDSELPGTLSRARATILPYDRFLTSGVLLLCLTYGLPVIAPSNSGVLEVLPTESHFLCFEPGNHKSCLEKMQELQDLSDEEYAKLSNACFERALEFNPEIMSQSYYDLLSLIAKG